MGLVVGGGRWDGWLVTNEWQKLNSCKLEDVNWDNMRIRDMGERAQYYIEETEIAKREKRKPFIFWFKKTPTLKKYVEVANAPITPWAILHNGKWLDRDDFETKEEWTREFYKLIDSLDPETEITVVDYHI